MKKTYHMTDQESALFREEISGVTPLSNDTIHPVRKAIKQKLQSRETQKKRDDASFYFSDQYVPVYKSDNPIAYSRDGEPSQTLKQLKRGLFSPELVLDLHGLNTDTAKHEIAALLAAAWRENVECVCIIHGIGERILKRQTPRWLVQHPAVRAFHQATLEWGGRGALLVALDLAMTR